MKFIKVGDYAINPYFVAYVEPDSPNFPKIVSIHVKQEVYEVLKAKECKISSFMPTSNSVLGKKLLPG